MALPTLRTARRITEHLTSADLGLAQAERSLADALAALKLVAPYLDDPTEVNERIQSLASILSRPVGQLTVARWVVAKSIGTVADLGEAAIAAENWE
jgi:hypothetical protein